jgi:hypothetical protein
MGLGQRAALKETAPAIARSAIGLRRCRCGGIIGPDGECSRCRLRRLAGEHGLAGRSGHDFSQLHVFAPGSAAGRSDGATGPRASRQVGPNEEERMELSAENVMMTLQGSGSCQNGGGASVCDPATGTYKITANNNTCCTKECTQEHEQIHVNDVTGWGCCKALSAAYNAKGADKNAAVTKYNTWMAKVIAITECNAYSNDVTCADRLAKANDCSGKGKNTDCCKDIADYRARYGASAKTQCAAAAKKVEPCPAF